MQSNPQVPSTPDGITVSETLIRGGAVILNLIQQAAKLTALPYLSNAAGLALSLVQIAQTVKDNQDGFQGLVDDSMDLVAVFYRAYQGAKDQENWLKDQAIQRAAWDLVQCLNSTQILGKEMSARRLIRRILYHPFDANTIKKCRQKLSSVTTQFQIAADLNVQDVLNQIMKKNEDIHADVKRLLAILDPQGSSPQTPDQRAIVNEHRARERFQSENADRPNNEPGSLQQIVFESPSNATFDEGMILHLGTEDLSPRVTKQVGVQGGSNMLIKRGFYGAGSTSVAKQVDAHQHEIEKEKLEMEKRRLALEEQRHQFEREKHFGQNRNSNVTLGQNQLIIEESVQ